MDLLNTISNHRLWNKYSVQIVWALAILVLLLALSRIGWSVYTQSKTKTANYQQQQVAPIRQAARPSYRVNDIVSANLFGDPSPKVVVTKAPKTTLDLTLQGILWASESGMARAIIMSGRRKSELYSVGESIKGAGASIKEIRDDEVLLNRNGATESLPLVKKTTSGNRQIISFADAQPQVTTVSTVSSSRASTATQALEQLQAKPQSPNGKPRKIRKPNFSGLDRALKKMGEI